MKPLVTCLWFDDRAEEAVRLYDSCFRRSAIGRIQRYSDAGAVVSGQSAGSVMSVDFSLEGLDFVALNGGPVFDFTPASSLFFDVSDEAYLDAVWETLSAEGTILMEYGPYPFSPKFGWIQDKFGLSWQLSLDMGSSGRLRPFLMFVGKRCGSAEGAIDFYGKVLPEGSKGSVTRADDGKMLHMGEFSAAGQDFIARDDAGPHAFDFSPALSFMVPCDTQAEIDRLWAALTEGGAAMPCGWVTDRFGVSWQVIPSALEALLAGSGPAGAKAAEQALYGMGKIDIEALRRAGGISADRGPL